MTDHNNTNDWTPAAGASPFESGQSGALDWDSAIHNTGAEFVLLPEGDYPFTVTKFERQRHPGSAKLPPCGKAQLTLTLDGGPLGTAAVTHNLFLHTKTEWKIYQFFESIGQHAQGSGEPLHPRWNEVLGASGRCHAAVEEYRSTKYGDTRKRNEITQFYPAQPGGRTGTPSAPAAQTVPAAADLPAQPAAEQTAMPLPKARRTYF